MLAYVTTPRHEGPEVNREMAEKDTKVLYKAGEKRLGTDEKTFVQIFSERSAAHLAAITSYYHSMYGHSLKKVSLPLLFPSKVLFCCLSLLNLYPGSKEGNIRKFCSCTSDNSSMC